MASFRQGVKQLLIGRQHRRYGRELASADLTYDGWIRAREKKSAAAAPPLVKSELVPVRSLFRNPGVLTEGGEADVLIITLYEGTLNESALSLILDRFASDERLSLVYGDEDVLTDGVRTAPWFKPDWSPDRFLSQFYFGALVAVRTSALVEAHRALQSDISPALKMTQMSDEEKLYVLLFELLMRRNAFSMGLPGENAPVCHIPRILYHSAGDGADRISVCRLPEECLRVLTERLWGDRRPERQLLSIVIPSKDHPDVLFRCVDSLLEKTIPVCDFEIILVDNGSNETNKSLIDQKVESLNRSVLPEASGCSFRGCRYLYEPMPFNFSHMCNLGAKNAAGELLLFLNDDMEILQGDWMRLMAEKALLSYAGAVGAKLLYPGSDTIQHAGVTNLRLGPAHKLQFLSDGNVYYHGMNRGVHDMLAVTGACLMIRRSVFDAAGGFFEGLAVAFNDVDLCYSLHEMGYYNIVRNDVAFYHHESLSRGADGASKEKLDRLQSEWTTLYERHPELYGRDPFYHPLLTADSLEEDYYPACHYPASLCIVQDMAWAGAKEITGKTGRFQNDKCLTFHVESIRSLYKWKYGIVRENAGSGACPEDFGYYLEGYAYIAGADNSCYEKRLLLRNCEDGRVWSLPIVIRNRQDVKKTLSADQSYVDLTGFAVKLRSTELPPGRYRLGFTAVDRCSTQKLINWGNCWLEITPEDMR